MTSAVAELQREALDRNVRVSDLLRRAFVVARKLALSEFLGWIELELNGYGSEETNIPAYREVHGHVRAWNPSRGWIPVIFESPQQGEKLSKQVNGQSIAELEDLIEESGSDSFHMPYSQAIQRELCQSSPFQTEITLFIPSQAIVHIIDAVRMIVLNWALKLEEDGILGDGMFFTTGEKEIAGRAPQHITNFFGSVHNAQIQQGGNQPLQVNTTVDLPTVQAFIHLLRGHLSTLELTPEQQQEVEAELRTVEAQVDSPKPKSVIIRESLFSLRSILEKGAGAAVGQILVELGKLII